MRVVVGRLVLAFAVLLAGAALFTPSPANATTCTVLPRVDIVGNGPEWVQLPELLNSEMW